MTPASLRACLLTTSLIATLVLSTVASFDSRTSTRAAGQAVDSDGDGCSDEAELGPNPIFGGRRDPSSPWDFFDTPPAFDKRVTIGDIYGVVTHFGQTVDPLPGRTYDHHFDRSPPPPGADPWDTGPPDGKISASDITAAVVQMGHTCTAPAPAPAQGLPSHFFLGLANSPERLSWMTGSGVPWDARYQYLTADWSAWKSPAGEFALDYMRASRSSGYLPVFTYYRLVPISGYDEGNQLLATLRNDLAMAAYYIDFRLLMQQAAQFGGPVIVHVEPDVWGHLEQWGEDALARSLAQNLVVIRDQSAPNVILAYHASPWGSGTDVALNNNTSVDVVAAARRAASFYNGLGASFDLIFSEVSDRDAAYYEIVRGTTLRWWSSSNYARYNQYLGELHAATGKPIVVWQIPLGNTIYRSLDNTPKHYQDNRVQTWLTAQGLGDLRSAGVVGLLFGGGAGDQTHYDDSASDGVTNPPPINGNNASAQVADDDGGLLRERAAAYYRDWGPLPLP